MVVVTTKEDENPCLSCDLQGRRGTGRLASMWRKDTEAEMANARKTWKELEEMAQDKILLKTFDSLCFLWKLKSQAEEECTFTYRY
ncbi:hypothetical protein ElyMa_006148500 [Elysia marginata]|uniref:Uncharacterized protein n=1 Tax=Elysia marginata TaxID=1093978 RepID=A0AAV4GYB0_9GAST|nr:hypothetical protein ElyMa_006148500 [Elysia marginata]